MLNSKLFARMDDLYKRRDRLHLNDEQARVLELHHTWFVRAGARLGRKAKARVAEINERLATLATQFAQNVLNDEQSWRLVLEGERDLAGLPDSRARRGGAGGGRSRARRASMSSRCRARASSRSCSSPPAATCASRRSTPGSGAARTAARPTTARSSAEIVALRAELARLLGYETYAEYSLDDTMAKTPAAVRELLTAVWPAAVKRAGEERAALQERARAEGGNFEIAAWDWRYFAEKERKARFDLDEAATRPYLSLDNVIAAAFDTATRLFGLALQGAAATRRATIRTCGSGRCATSAAPTSGCSSATTSRGPRSARARG